MKWYALKSNRCPKCNGDFAKGLQVKYFNQNPKKIFVHTCKFSISEDRFNEIVMNQVDRQINANNRIDLLDDFSHPSRSLLDN